MAVEVVLSGEEFRTASVWALEGKRHKLVRMATVLMPNEIRFQTKGRLLTGRYWTLVFSFMFPGPMLAKHVLVLDTEKTEVIVRLLQFAAFFKLFPAIYAEVLRLVRKRLEGHSSDVV